MSQLPPLDPDLTQTPPQGSPAPSGNTGFRVPTHAPVVQAASPAPSRQRRQAVPPRAAKGASPGGKKQTAMQHVAGAVKIGFNSTQEFEAEVFRRFHVVKRWEKILARITYGAVIFFLLALLGQWMAVMSVSLVTNGRHAVVFFTGFPSPGYSKGVIKIVGYPVEGGIDVTLKLEPDPGTSTQEFSKHLFTISFPASYPPFSLKLVGSNLIAIEVNSGWFATVDRLYGVIFDYTKVNPKAQYKPEDAVTFFSEMGVSDCQALAHNKAVKVNPNDCIRDIAA